LAAQEHVARPASRTLGARFALVVALTSFLMTTSSARGRAESAAPDPTSTAALIDTAIDATQAPSPANPALDFRSPTPAEAKPSIFRRWWFWAAVGTAAAATVVVIVVSARGSAPPATNLGNQEFRP